MTIKIAPQTEAKLKEMASREGREVNALADDLLTAVVKAADRDHLEMMEGIERGRQAYAEGRSRPFSEDVSDVLQLRQDRDAAYAQEPERIDAYCLRR